MCPPPPDPELDAYVAELVAGWPPLTDDQVNRISVLIAQEPGALDRAA